MNITDEAVEAAARVLDPQTMSSGGALAEKFKEQTTAEARAILEAAASYIRAQALREAADALELQPPQLRAQYVATLRLYADEPWRLSNG